MMTNLLNGAQVANKLFSTIARLRLLLVMLLTLTVSTEVWGQSAEVNSILWQESFTGTTTSTTTTFTASTADVISDVANVENGTTMFQSADIASLKYTASNVMLTATTGTNCTAAHIWLNKQTTAYFQAEGIPLYGATKVCIMWNQGGASSITAHYKLDDGDWTPIHSTSSAAANITSSDINTTNKKTIAVKFVRTSTKTNIRLDDLRIKVTEATSSCGSKVTINTTNDGHGTITASPTSIETCSDNDEDRKITITLNPNQHYSSNTPVISGIANATITGSGNTYTVQLPKSSNGTLNISATFKEDAKYTVTWSADGTPIKTQEVYVNEQVSEVPTSSDIPEENRCGDKFVGWTIAPIATPQNEAPDVFTTVAGSPTITEPTTFYAVFADYEQ
ncbi:MAG: hypothetical protein IKB40_04560 [Paludibacteraceae bacterium]|nr:hypothetical protein [Paludibacteraceae bacterium]